MIFGGESGLKYILFSILCLVSFGYFDCNLSKLTFVPLVLYGVVCTAIAHSMFIEGLKHVKVQTAGIISGLESVYGIIAAMIILHEIPTGKELIGGAIILGVVFYTTLQSEKE